MKSRTWLVAAASAMVLVFTLSAAAMASTGKVTGTIVNLRGGPSTSDTIVGKLSLGQQVTILGEQSGWYQVETASGTQGWTSGQYIDTSITPSTSSTDPASSSAAGFRDVTGNSAQSTAIYRLNSLGIVNGYPDGTFGPNKTITRAEFAKIADYLAGLGSSVTGMQSTPSSFKDLKTSDWFNGAVNLAASQGFVEGYPDGTFRPNRTVTQAEVITVLMRILGYDNLAGTWPDNYTAKATDLGVLDDVTNFSANVAAARGMVCVAGSATLDQKDTNTPAEGSETTGKLVVTGSTVNLRSGPSTWAGKPWM